MKVNFNKFRLANMKLNRVCVLALYTSILFLCYSVNCEDKNVDGRTKADEILLWDILNECMNGVDSISTCLKTKVLNYYDYNMERVASPRSLKPKDQHRIDKMVIKRFQRYLNTHEFHVKLPEFLFQGTTMIFRPGKSIADFDVEFPESNQSEANEVTSARDMMKDKMLLPLLLMLKMKMKMITPILLMLVSIKATKALVFSKLALLLVILFLASQFLKKIGMTIPLLSHSLDSLPLPMSMPMMTTAAPVPSYGPPQPPSSSYGEPPSSWEPSSNTNSFSRMWDAHQMAYNSYLPTNSNNNNNNNSNKNENSNSPMKV